MNTLRSVLALTAVGALTIGGSLSGWAGEGSGGSKEPNIAPPASVSAAKPSASAQLATDLSLAFSLIHYGRTHKSPEALLTAAQMLSKIPTTEVKGVPMSEERPRAPEKTEKKTTTTPDNGPEALVAEARKMSSAPHITALANAVAKAIEETPRGAVGGPAIWDGRVPAFRTDIFRISFRANEVAVFALSGDGDTDLDLYVYDELANLIASDSHPGDDCIVRWYPRRTAPFTIKIVNRGPVYNNYLAVHN